jgi:hypothetical protein
LKKQQKAVNKKRNEHRSVCVYGGRDREKISSEVLSCLLVSVSPHNPISGLFVANIVITAPHYRGRRERKRGVQTQIRLHPSLTSEISDTHNNGAKQQQKKWKSSLKGGTHAQGKRAC